ncbi:MAG TPA: prepilin peptidase [Hyphomicrobiaceae bacterium]|nr:prepilin peptidase [Hyphomicrobiaceae bacterium]
MYEFAVLTILPAAVIFAAAFDLFTMTIPNRISLALIGGFFLIAPFSSLTLVDIGWHVAAAAIVLAITFTLFAFGFLGGGDAKLATAIALWLGISNVVDFWLLATVLGGLLALAFLSFRKLPLPFAWAEAEWIQRLHKPNGGIPYGVALAAAALLIYKDSFWFRSLG